EKNIRRELALGKTTKDIAAEKFLSFHTINAHRRNIYRILNVHSENEVTRYALQAGLIDLMVYYIRTLTHQYRCCCVVILSRVWFCLSVQIFWLLQVSSPPLCCSRVKKDHKVALLCHHV